LTTSIPFDDFGGHGPLLHFAHANGYPPGCYHGLLDRLGENHQVIAIRQRPLWPNSSPESIESWHDMAEDLITLFDQSGFREVIGVGHSLGAVVTMTAAVERPELFRALVLIEPVFLMPAILQRFVERAASERPEDIPWVTIAQSRRNHWSSRQAAFQHFRPKRVFARLSDDSLWDYVDNALHQDGSGGYELTYPPEWEARIYALPPTDVWQRLPQVTQPTLAVRGAESDTLAPAAWQLWQVSQRAASFVEMAGSGHLLPLENPAEVADQINQFLETL
jgi:pimeloyl-ACP methyl ester carboxylesterase